jgi:hypothetical protein
MLGPDWVFLRHTGVLCAALLALSICAPAQKSSSSSGTGGHPAPMPAPTPVRSNGSPSYNPIAAGGFNSPFFNMGMSSPEQVTVYNRLQRQERHKRVVKDTERLVALTSEYQHALTEQGQTAETDRKLREIEKLAREVRTTLVQ